MSRARNIKPGFFKNDLLAECSPLARILFAGLWCEADREGRMEDRPKRLKADILPYDDCDLDELLNDLASRGFIVRYVVDGIGYIAIPEFKKHQNPHVKEAASSIPAPNKPGASPVQAPEVPEQAGLIPDSPSLIPDSPKKPLARQAARFPEFWDAYPVKKGRKEAEAKWRARNLDAIADRILADVAARKTQDRQWLEGFIPHGSTYVNGAGWEDAIETGRPAAAPPRNLVGGSPKKTETPESKLEDARLLAERMVDLGQWTPEQAMQHVEKFQGAPA